MKIFLLLTIFIFIDNLEIETVFKETINKLPRSSFDYRDPSANELNEWNEITHKMLFLNNKQDCTNIRLNLLNNIYKINFLDDKFCILYENTSKVKGWGTFFTKIKNNGLKKFIHIQVPHPFTDGSVHEQGLFF